jgi:hypothetical protein
VFTVFSGAIVILFRAVINNILTKKLEIELHEHHTKFSQIHSKRGEIIADLYSKLADTHRTAVELVTLGGPPGMPKKDKRREIFSETWNNFYIFYDRNKIFLTDQINSCINDFIKNLQEEIIGFDVYILRPASGKSMDIKAMKKWQECYKQIGETKIPLIKGELENELRKIIEI